MATVQTVGIIAFGLCLLLVATVLPLAVRRQAEDDIYYEGWEACMDAHDNFEMSDDDKAVLVEMKSAVWLYLRKNNLNKRGDKTVLNGVEDFASLKAYVWETCIYRREHE